MTVFNTHTTLNRDIESITELTAEIRGLLQDEDTPAPILYRDIIHGFELVSRAWENHVRRLESVSRWISYEDTHISVFLAQFRKDSHALGEQLKALCGAGWPRTPDLAMNALRARTGELLAALTIQIEKERKNLLPWLVSSELGATVSGIEESLAPMRSA